MSGYLLDTSILSDMISNPNGRAARHAEKVEPRDICTSITVAAELRLWLCEEGIAAAPREGGDLLETIQDLRWTCPPPLNTAASEPSWRWPARLFAITIS